MIPCEYEWGRKREGDSYCGECVEAGVNRPRLVLAFVKGEYALKCVRDPEHERTVLIPGAYEILNQKDQIRWHARKKGERG